MAAVGLRLRTQWRQGRVLGSSATPEAMLWLRQIAEPFLLRAEAPEPIAAEKFGPAAEPRWLRPEDGMRLALAFSAARWLVTPRQRRLFREGLEELPSEVVLYWFTLCFYGYRQAAGRAALRTLFTHEEPEDMSADRPSARRKRKRRARVWTEFVFAVQRRALARGRDTLLSSYGKIDRQETAWRHRRLLRHGCSWRRNVLRMHASSMIGAEAWLLSTWLVMLLSVP